MVLEFGFSKRLGIYISNNANSNNTIWKVVLSVLYLDYNLKASHSRCLSHIINLATKAFIFDKNVAAFKTIIDTINDTTPQNSPAIRAA